MPLLRWIVVLALAAALIAGGAALASRRAELPHAGAPVSPAPTRTPASGTAVRAVLTREQAIARVRGSGEVVRVDRIEAKLVPWDEFAPAGMGVDRTGGPGHGGGVPIPAVWAVAVAGELRPNLGDLRPQLTYPWALYGLDPVNDRIATLKVDVTGSWPPGFDALADHVAIAPTPAPPTPAPLRFTSILSGVNPLPQVRELAASDAEALHLWALEGDDANGPRLIRSDDGGATWRTPAALPPRGSGPLHVAAAGAVVLVSDPGLDTAAAGVSTSGGLYLSKDAGATWRRVRDGAMGRVTVIRSGRSMWFLAEQIWATNGAATGPSQIWASADGETWRRIGEVPGPASFGALDVPLVSFSKNTPGDGIFRVEGTELEALRLVPVQGSTQAWSLLTNGQQLWSFANGTARSSSDGGRTWRDASNGLQGRLAGIFAVNGTVYAIGDGGYFWDPGRSEWRIANLLVGKGAAVFQLGDAVVIQDLPGGLWRYPK